MREIRTYGSVGRGRKPPYPIVVSDHGPRCEWSRPMARSALVVVFKATAWSVMKGPNERRTAPCKKE